MNRTEATAVYAILMFALAAGTIQHWAVNSPRVKALIAAHHHAMTTSQASQLAQLDMPAMENFHSAEINSAMIAADHAHMARALETAKKCNRVQIRLAMAQARAAAREFRLHDREMRHQWVMVTPAEFNVRVQPAQVEVSNP